MKKIIKNLILLMSISMFQICNSQTSPPDIALPNDENTKLIIEIIKVTQYENYFQNYCLEKINYAATNESWDEIHKEKIKKSINFEYFNDTVFNMFSQYSTKSLKKLIKTYKRDKKSNIRNLIISNQMVNNNLKLYADSIVKGKYVL